jgi:DNA polymerase III epsilon subunit-like protein
MNACLYIDFETSGLDSSRHGILQAAWIVEMNGNLLVERSMDVCLRPNDDISPMALSTNNFTLDRIMAGRDLSIMVAALKEDLRQGSAYFPLCGHNVQFDVGFLIAALKKTNEHIYDINFKCQYDTRSIMAWEAMKHGWILPDYKLETCCRYFNIPLVAHDALNDIRSTRELFKRLAGERAKNV